MNCVLYAVYTACWPHRYCIICTPLILEKSRNLQSYFLLATVFTLGVLYYKKIFLLVLARPAAIMPA